MTDRPALTISTMEKVFSESCITHHIDSFNDLVTNGLMEVIESEGNVELVQDGIRTIFSFRNAVVEPPTTVDSNRNTRPLFPDECLDRDLTYEGSVLVDIVSTVVDNDNRVEKVDTILRYPLFKLPVMVGSVMCSTVNRYLTYDTDHDENEFAGYFIIKGKERVLVSQERMRYNNFIVNSNVDSVISGEMRSMSLVTRHSVCVVISMNKTKDFITVLPYSKAKVNVGLLFRALGMSDSEISETFDAIVTRVIPSEPELQLLKRKILYKTLDMTQEGALAEIANLVGDSQSNTSRLIDDLFPHLSIESKNKEKVECFLRCIKRLILVYLGRLPVDHRDHLANKRIETSGTLIKEIYRMAYKRFIRQVATAVSKNSCVKEVLTKINQISRDLRYSFSTGNWGSSKSTYMRTGVSQVASRLSYISMLSHLRRVVVPIGREVKSTEIRQVHQSTAFFIDATETPEGSCIGIVKNFSMGVVVSLTLDDILIVQIISRLLSLKPHRGVDTTETETVCFEVCVGGRCYGTTSDADAVNTLRKARFEGRLPGDGANSISITCCDGFTINVETDEGRLLRPLREISSRTVVYLCADELNEMVVAMTEDDIVQGITTHIEIHPSMMLGVVTSAIPFVEHNQAPRICYYSNMIKQAIGVFSRNWQNRFDTSFNVLVNAQRPLVTTKASEILVDHSGTGVNCILAIANYYGWNQEDAIIMNKSSIERGLFTIFSFRSITVEDRRIASNVVVEICNVPEQFRKQHSNFDKLDPFTGIIKKGSSVVVGDVLVGRLSKKTVKNEITLMDTSVVTSLKEEGVVDKILVTTSVDGYKLIKIRIRVIRVPELGDKFATRSAQKSTIGLIARAEDMPFTKDGTIPDIIMNPAALPSRMTVAQLLESVLGKSSDIADIHDASPWNEENVSREIVSDSTEFLYNGITGEKMISKIFIGPVFYHRLKHLVSEKIYARSFGSLQTLTMQPGSGRSRQGALRLGAMETSCLVGQGGMNTIIDRLYHASDKFSVKICVCGQNVSGEHCEMCNSSEIRNVKMPYCNQLLNQHLAGLGIKTASIPEKKSV